MKDTINIILFGDSLSGKTALIFRYANNGYISKHLSTIGIEFETCYLNFSGRRIKIILYDTPGQRRFVNMTKQYIRGNDIIIFVYSVKDRTSFERIKAFWLPVIKKEQGEDDDGKLIRS